VAYLTSFKLFTSREVDHERMEAARDPEVQAAMRPMGGWRLHPMCAHASPPIVRIGVELRRGVVRHGLLPNDTERWGS
jgi:hypothetical protein